MSISQVQISRTVIESVAVSITPSSLQQFTIFVIELVEGSKALYKPCATFKVMIRYQMSNKIRVI